MQALGDGFTAVCDADGVHAYRHDTTMSGDDMGAEWTSGEKFAGKWRFTFDGERIEIDGEEAGLLFWDGNVLAATTGDSTDSSVSIWTYAINLDLEDIVAAQVNAYRVMGTGIKTRAVNFVCEFTYHPGS